MTEQTPRDDQAPHRADVPQHGGDEAGSDVPEVMRGFQLFRTTSTKMCSGCR